VNAPPPTRTTTTTTLSTGSRLRANRFVAAPLVALGTFGFMTAVPFLPGAPVFPLLVAAGLGFLSIRSPGWASGTLLAVSFFSITWQLLGFGLLNLFNTVAGSALAIVLLAILLVNPISAREDPAALALVLLAVATMLTPYYYLSIGLVVLAMAVGERTSSLPRVSITFVETLAPLLIVENALYFASPKNTGSSPVIFSQLSNFAQSLRPALPGLNLYLTGLPKNFLSANADSVVRFLSSGAVSVLIVPIALLGIATTSTVLVSSILSSRLPSLEFSILDDRTQGIRVAISPLLVSGISALPFIFLISIFSLPGIGGYQETLGGFDSLFMVGGSSAFSCLVVAREAFVWRYERSELVRTKILELMARMRKMIEEGRGITARILSSAPSVNVSKESNEIGVDSSYLDDVSRGVEAANHASLVQWLDEIERRLVPSLDALLATLNSKVVHELERTSALARSHNNLLAEVGSPIHFSRMMDEGGGSSTYAGLEVAIREYDLTISAIKNESLQLYDDYVATTRSFNRLVDRAVGPPPVDPASLFEAHDYSGGMRLVVEEYWMNFHLKYQQELQNKIVALKNVANELRRLISTKQQKQLDEIIGTLAPVRPAAATIILDGMEKLRALLRLVIDQEIAKIEDAKKIVVSLVPSGELLLGLEFTLRLEMLRSLQDRGLLALLTFDDVTDLMTLMASSLAGVRAQEMRDEKKLIVLSQYPVAKRLIERRARPNAPISADDLPFERDASITFMKLYASANKEANFDSSGEVLVIRNAKVR
jgi:hypothetical protein